MIERFCSTAAVKWPRCVVMSHVRFSGVFMSLIVSLPYLWGDRAVKEHHGRQVGVISILEFLTLTCAERVKEQTHAAFFSFSRLITVSASEEVWHVCTHISQSAFHKVKRCWTLELKQQKLEIVWKHISATE